MSNISASMVKELRERTGLGMMDCKKALVDSNGDMEEAIKLLREKGIIKSAKKSGRETNEGIIKTFYSTDRKECIMLMMNCETDFVVRNNDFQILVDEIGNDILNNNSINTIDDTTEEINNKISDGIAKIGENIKIGNFYRMSIENDKEYIEDYIHSNSKVGSLLKVKVEKNETKNNESFKMLVKDLCMQIAAMNVKAISKDDVDEKLLQEEREIYIKQAKETGKPDNLVE
jgi:elongation factor Ts